MIKNLIWDLDGTLYHSYQSMANSLKEALRVSFIEVPEDRIFSLLKESVSYAIQKLAQEEGLLAENLREHFKKIEEEKQYKEIQLFDEMNEFLSDTVKAGMKHFILTHRDRKTTLFLLHRDGIDSFFQGILCGDDGFPRKPDPKGLSFLCQKYMLLKEESIVIGDRELDCETAKNAGMGFVLVDFDRYSVATKYEGISTLKILKSKIKQGAQF